MNLRKFASEACIGKVFAKGGGVRHFKGAETPQKIIIFLFQGGYSSNCPPPSVYASDMCITFNVSSVRGVTNFSIDSFFKFINEDF